MVFVQTSGEVNGILKEIAPPNDKFSTIMGCDLSVGVFKLFHLVSSWSDNPNKTSVVHIVLPLPSRSVGLMSFISQKKKKKKKTSPPYPHLSFFLPTHRLYPVSLTNFHPKLVPTFTYKYLLFMSLNSTHLKEKC